MAYSDAEKAEALIRLARNGYDFKKTADELGLQIRTLRRWDKNVPKKSFVSMLTWAAEQLIIHIPLDDMNVQSWGIALGILTDKILLFQGQATSRSETITRKLGDLDNDDIGDVLAEAERIINEAESSRVAEGVGDS